ncbi:MAG TPA: DUF6519 domain-containing protein [Chthoniobacterales bacterium]|nr:DUF6519 domain-containing protein [Chthoniobacterales bacterium]
MSIDISRQRFNPLKDFSGVLMQQGRVQLDSDWNDFVEILGRRSQAGTTDIIGRCVVPRETPDGFKISVSGTDLLIGPGRIYVDGLLAENHGEGPFVFDPVLGELRGSNPVLYSKQPYLPPPPPPPALPTTGTHLVYVDVWKREVTFLEDPDLVEKAVGVDTTARLQTVWQVKVLPNVGNAATCGGAIQAWNDLIAPSAGRLSTDAKGVPSQTDPCLIPPTGGFLGLENQLYRVEIHDGGPVGTATFKWSRENASVTTNINGIVPATNQVQLQVDSVGRDSVLGFTMGDWIEITDDARELAGLPGIMRKVASIAPDAKMITFNGTFGTNESPDLNKNARITRWDHSQKVFDANNQAFFDLDASTSRGVIPVPAATTTLRLENGVEVTFSVDPAGGKFHTGDYWVFAARTADASVEKLDKAASRGIHHHFGRLAIVTLPGPVSDCRVLWPPEECCDCSVCVSADSHNSGRFTIQQAIDKIKDVGGTICLGPGLYQITSANPVRIDGARAIRLKGQSWLTILLSMDGPGMVISNSLRVTVEDLSVVSVVRSEVASFAVSLVNSSAVTLQRCAIVLWGGSFAVPSDTGGAAIGLSGFVIETRICDNVIYGGDGVELRTGGNRLDGIGGLRQRVEPGTLVDFRLNLIALLRIDNNCIFASGNGVNFDASFVHLAENRIAGNFITGCKSAGIEMRGMVPGRGLLGSRLDIHGNDVSTAGRGIVIGTNQTRITGNDISSSTIPDQPRIVTFLNAGILLAPGGVDNRIEQCEILENRINRMGGLGISLATRIGSAMIKQNIIDGAGLGGIVMDLEGRASAEVLTIENNQISNVAVGFNGGFNGEGASVGFNQETASIAGIRVSLAQQATIAGNTIVRVGLDATVAAEIAGLRITDSISLRIAGNTIFDIAPPGQFANLAGGILVSGLSGRIDVSDNQIKRNRSGQGQSIGRWVALLIDEEPPGLGSFALETARRNLMLVSGILIPIPLARRSIGVHDNLFEAYGEGAAAVEVVSSTAACLFNDNRCILETNTSQRVARIEGNAIILNANYFQGPLTPNPNYRAVTINSHNGPFTIVGNMFGGQLLVNTLPAVPPPWTDLNIYTQ